MTEKQINPRRIRFKCRRGMLELDILLSRFFDQHFSKLTTHEQELFDQLLDAPDPELYLWLLEQKQPDDKRLLEILTIINTH